jgi:putative solute:sodium symporter small subunit
MQLTERHRAYWRKNLNLTVVLIAIWFVATFVISFFARELQSISIMGWPFPFYMAAQGSLVIYLVIIWFYARKMKALDEEFGVAEQED